MDELNIVPVAEMPKPPDIVRAPSEDVVGLVKTALRMLHLCVKEEGIGLAAVQVGIPWQMFVTHLPDDPMGCFINASYEPDGDVPRRWSVEGCLSLPCLAGGERLSYAVLRYPRIRFRATRLRWDTDVVLEPMDEVVEGLRAVVFQHETDHQLGILISDVGHPVKQVRSLSRVV